MKHKLVVSTVLLLISLLFWGDGGAVHAQNNNKLLAVIATNDSLATFREAVEIAGISNTLDGWGPMTLFAPTDEAFRKMPASLRTQLFANPTAMRQLLLHHLLPNTRAGAAQIGQLGTSRNALGQNLTFVIRNNELIINEQARVNQSDIYASNGVIHIIDTVLTLATTTTPPPTQAPANSTPPSSTEPLALESEYAPLDLSFTAVNHPSQNRAYIPGGHIPYWEGVQATTNGCKGMTWVVLRQGNGATQIGADRKTNPYRGDTPCSQARPLLCFTPDGSLPVSTATAGNWARGRLRATQPVAGTVLSSLTNANRICQTALGTGWRMATFHETSGWEFWARGGGLPTGMRYWVAIGDQPANPWDYTQIPTSPPYADPAASVLMNPWQNAAFRSGTRMTLNQGVAAGRRGCKGMTWVVLQQNNGLANVGADALTNPYRGDTGCGQSLPALCIQVNNYAQPSPRAGMDVAHNWSGGQIKLTHPIPATQLNSRSAAANLCERSFGEGWRLAEHHDGSFSVPGGSAGWEFWAYGSLRQVQTRFWVSISDQPANPWNPWGG